MTTPEQAHPVTIATDEAGVVHVRCATCDVEIADSSAWAHVEGDAMPFLSALIAKHRDDYWLERTGYTRAQLDALCQCGETFGKHSPSGYGTCRGFRPAVPGPA